MAWRRGRRLDDVAHALLHEARLRGHLDTGAPAAGRRAVAALERAGLVRRVGDRLLVTEAGRAADDGWARLGGEQEDAARRAYAAFLPLNRALLHACSDWQVVRGGVPNDHADPAYDEAVVRRLATIDDRIAPVLERVAAAVPRFAGYRPALAAARARVEAGDGAWFTSPTCDSYHTVWMRLHEELLCGLGLRRADEPPA